MAQIVYPGDATQEDVAKGKKFSAGPLYNATGTSTKKYSVGDTVPMSDLQSSDVWVSAWANNFGENETGADGVSTDPDGLFLYVGLEYMYVRRLNPATGARIWDAKVESQIYDTAIDSVGNVYVASNQMVRKIDPGGTVLWSVTDIYGATAIDVDDENNVYVGYLSCIRKLNPSGGEIWINNQVVEVTSVAVDKNKNVYVACQTRSPGSQIGKLNSSGVVVWSRTNLPYGSSVAVDPVGNVIWCSYEYYSDVIKLSPSGADIWRNDGVGNATCVAVDPAGNDVFVLYEDSSSLKLDKTIRRLDPITGYETWSAYVDASGRGMSVDKYKNVYTVGDKYATKPGVLVRKYNRVITGYKILR